MKKHVSVPWWMWNVYWVLDLLGSDNWLQALGAILMIVVGVILTSNQ